VGWPCEYEAKFSAQFVVATCLLKGAFGLADLMPAALKDPAVLDLAARVTCTIDPDSAFPTFFSAASASNSATAASCSVMSASTAAPASALSTPTACPASSWPPPPSLFPAIRPNESATRS
jgi:MmgE/PrpD C-terminal domain